MSRYSLDKVAQLYQTRGVVCADIAWDLDNDLEYDVESDDADMRKQAKQFQKSGLTKLYASENLALIDGRYPAGQLLDRTIELCAQLDFDDLHVRLHLGGGSYGFADALSLMSSELMRGMMHEGDQLYIQPLSYFQLFHIRFETDSGVAYPIEQWRVVQCIRALQLRLSDIETRTEVTVKPGRVYRAVNGALILMCSDPDCDDGLVGRIINPDVLKLSWSGEFTYDRSGAVIGLEDVPFLPMHPDMVFSIQEDLGIDLPPVDQFTFALGSGGWDEDGNEGDEEE